MPYERIPGFKGKIYIPEKKPGKKKHNCVNCYSCQMCSDRRCELCLRSQASAHKKDTQKK